MKKNAWKAALFVAGLVLSVAASAKTPDASSVSSQEAAGRACIAMADTLPGQSADARASLVRALEPGPVASRVDTGRPTGSDSHSPRNATQPENRPGAETAMAQALLAAAARTPEAAPRAVACDEFAGAFVRDLCDWYEASERAGKTPAAVKESPRATAVSAIHRVLIDSVGVTAAHSVADGEGRSSPARRRN